MTIGTGNQASRDGAAEPDRDRAGDQLSGTDPRRRRAGGAPGLAPLEFARWVWRQLTSMRTALILLFLLALGAVPGSVVPQQAVDALATSQWQRQHPNLTPLYTHLGLFSVYSSVWFSAIYILLMISLVGCIVPRTAVYVRALRARPPKPPRNFSRLPECRSFSTADDPDVLLDKARAALRGYRIDTHPGEESSSLSAERGYLRETGNLVFHISVLVVLAGFAIGSLFGYKGGVIVVTGDGFANSLSQYDDFRPGGLFRTSELAPFSFKVTSFDVNFIRSGRDAGMAHKFQAGLAYRPSPQAPERHTTIAVNHPLNVDGTDIYLISHGYAPHLTVRDGTGQVAFSGPVVFLPENQTFRSFGVVKVPDASPQQLGFEGEFYPTYAFTSASGPFSAFPDAKNPAISMLAYRGNLGLDNGVPQSVYSLDKSGLTPIRKADGRPLRVDLPLGATKTLPDHLGSITFDGVSRFVKLQVNRSPADWLTLLGASLALLGLLGSLFIRPRRIWVRTRREGGRTLVEVAGLDRSAGGDLASWIDVLTDELRPAITSEETS
ncbi:MAG: cytochrome c biogenesis protein ResB [Actinomycetota bacterium]|nr:cytochrome c biogenesis protein ResB [Actinomycetota bacterium]